MTETVCPNCGGEHVVAGQLRGPEGGPAEFYPEGLRTFGLPPRSVGVREEATAASPPTAAALACLSCGLLWARLARLELRELLVAKGDDAMRAWVAAVPKTSRPASRTAE